MLAYRQFRSSPGFSHVQIFGGAYPVLLMALLPPLYRRIASSGQTTLIAPTYVDRNLAKCLAERPKKPGSPIMT